MGRPEKPPSSAYSLFSKEMLNTEFIKQFPSKERMSHISEAWKKVTEGDKEIYQTQVNEAMSRYKTEYTEWYEALTSEEQRVEKERTTTKAAKKSSLAPLLTPSSVLPPTPTAYLPPAQQQQQPQQQFAISSPMVQQQPAGAQQSLQMPAITVPYPNITGSQAGQPMFVKVEVVGAPGSHNTVTQCQIMPHQMQMTYSMSQPPFTLGPIMAPAQQVLSSPQNDQHFYFPSLIFSPYRKCPGVVKILSGSVYFSRLLRYQHRRYLHRREHNQQR